MTRRLLSVALFCYLGLATWLLTGHFSAWGDAVAAVVDRVVTSDAFRFRSTAPAVGDEGLDFIEMVECMGGCTPIEGAGLWGVGALFFGGTPLALAALLAAHGERYRLVAGQAQAGFVLQCLSLVVSLPACGATLAAVADPAAAIFSGALLVGLLAVSNIMLGVPAAFAWRHLHARAFGAPRPLLAWRLTSPSASPSSSR